MQRDRLTLATFPTLLCAGAPPEVAARRHGTVILIHGLAGEKEDLFDELERFGREGFLALAIDAVEHGARRSNAFEDQLFDTPEAEEAAFHDVVRTTAGEIPSLLDAVAERGWLPSGAAAILGVSMGGFVALAARTIDSRVEVVISISGSPCWPVAPEQSPDQLLERFWPAAVLLLHGEADDVVPAAPGAAFVERLRPIYRTDPDRLRRITFPEAGHLFPSATWATILDHSTRFCHRFLASDNGEAGRAGVPGS